MDFFSRYNPARIEGKTFLLPTMTQQHFKEECDINNILKKYQETGLLENIGPGAYMDLMESTDYRQSLHTIMEADAAFQSLPANVRKEFQNDPALFMEFIHDPNNRERGIELGLYSPEVTQAAWAVRAEEKAAIEAALKLQKEQKAAELKAAKSVVQNPT